MTLDEYLIKNAIRQAWRQAADPNGREPTHQMVVNYLVGGKTNSAAHEYLRQFADLDALAEPLPLP